MTFEDQPDDITVEAKASLQARDLRMGSIDAATLYLMSDGSVRWEWQG